MKIRSKLQRLLLVTTLLPLLISSGIFLLLLSGLGTHFASDTKKILTDQSHKHLQTLIRDSGNLIQQKLQLINWVVTGQVHELEHNSTSRVTEQSFNRETLNALGQAFQHIRKRAPELILRQYVVFTSSQGYVLPPEQTGMLPVDLANQHWLAKTLSRREFNKQLVKDISNSSLNLVISAPFYNSSGELRGLTAIEVSLQKLFFPLSLPVSWQAGARVMLASINKQSESLIIAAEAKNLQNWYLPPESQSPDPSIMQVSANIIANQARNRFGVLKVSHKDSFQHWAYGPILWGEIFPLVMIEHDQVIAFALQSEQHVLNKTRLGLAFVGVGLLVFVVFSMSTAGHFANTVTEPVRKLSSAFSGLALGDFSTRVTIETDDEIEDLGHAFNELGVKLEDRNRMANSLALAREVQQHLLPSCPPTISGLDLFSRGMPCDEIGGDYYDFIFTQGKEETRLGVVVGDVSGHGVPAALLMAAARGVLRSHAGCHGGNLMFLFQLLNHQLVKDSSHEHFMTLFYGLLDRENGTLTWNSAGHGPVFLYRSQSQTLHELETTGPPLGIDETFSYEPLFIDSLSPGDILLAGTDGLWEGRNPSGDLWGIEAFKNHFLQLTSRAAQEIGQSLFTEVMNFRKGQKPDDDISLVIAKFI